MPLVKVRFLSHARFEGRSYRASQLADLAESKASMLIAAGTCNLASDPDPGPASTRAAASKDDPSKVPGYQRRG